MCVCAQVRMCAGAHVRMCVCMCVCMYVCMCVCVYVCTYVRMYVCTYVCMYVCMYVGGPSKQTGGRGRRRGRPGWWRCGRGPTWLSGPEPTLKLLSLNLTVIAVIME
ncbi:hypothetical protein Hanom_Chr12g01095341 [Helianthus anomalus]